MSWTIMLDSEECPYRKLYSDDIYTCKLINQKGEGNVCGAIPCAKHWQEVERFHLQDIIKSMQRRAKGYANHSAQSIREILGTLHALLQLDEISCDEARVVIDAIKIINSYK
ncbi:MAG: hypothetical protein ACTSRA_00020 [Promethearchaeota archaeon]|nr:MAG: hypothetical protein [Helarchaeota virus Nidhogg Meg22_1012]